MTLHDTTDMTAHSTPATDAVDGDAAKRSDRTRNPTYDVFMEREVEVVTGHEVYTRDNGEQDERAVTERTYVWIAVGDHIAAPSREKAIQQAARQQGIADEDLGNHRWWAVLAQHFNPLQPTTETQTRTVWR